MTVSEATPAAPQAAQSVAQPVAPPVPRARVRTDWKRAAALLVDGETPAAVAAALGIAEEKLWRHLRASLRFQFLLRQARERRLLLARLRFEAASADAALRSAQQVAASDGETLKWLAGESGLRDAGAAKESGGDVIAQLSATGRRPPNQALVQRLEAQRKAMDAEFAETKRLFVAKYGPPLKAAATPPKPDLRPDKTE